MPFRWLHFEPVGVTLDLCLLASSYRNGNNYATFKASNSWWSVSTVYCTCAVLVDDRCNTFMNVIGSRMSNKQWSFSLHNNCCKCKHPPSIVHNMAFCVSFKLSISRVTREVQFTFRGATGHSFSTTTTTNPNFTTWPLLPENADTSKYSL